MTLDLDTLVLRSGTHTSSSDGVSLMEAVSGLAAAGLVEEAAKLGALAPVDRESAESARSAAESAEWAARSAASTAAWAAAESARSAAESARAARAAARAAESAEWAARSAPEAAARSAAFELLDRLIAAAS